MNIFVTDPCPIKSAEMLCDQHVRSKMIIETVQILQSCFSLNRMTMEDCPKTQTGTARRHGHYNHRCCVWARESRANMKWLIEHAKTMEIVRQLRWPGTTPHFSSQFITWAENYYQTDSVAPDTELTPFRIAIPEDAQCRYIIKNFNNFDTFSKYRYYIALDKNFATWTPPHSPPKWISIIQHEAQCIRSVS